MKKISTLIIVLLIVFLTPNVDAYKIGDTFYKQANQFSGDSGVRYNGSTIYYNSGYMINDTNSTLGKHYIYCLDPYLARSSTLKIKRLLMNSQSIEAQDYGMISILKNGYWTGQNLGGLTQAQYYNATSYAIRMLVNGVFGWNSYVVNTNYFFESMINTAYVWISNDAEMKAAYIKIKTAQKKDTSVEAILSQFGYKANSSRVFSGGESTLSKAKELLKVGLEATANYYDNSIKKPTATVTQIVTPKTESTEDGDNTVCEKVSAVSIKFENFTENGEFKYIEHLLDNSSDASIEAFGYSLEAPDSYDAEDLNYTPFNLGTDLLKIIRDQTHENNGTIYMVYKLKLTVPTSELEADSTEINNSANITINYTYNDDTLLNGGVLADGTYVDSYSYQRFVFFTSDPKPGSKTLINIMCDDACNPKLGIPVICKDGLEPDEEGNVTYESREAYNENTKKYNIVKCVLNKTDIAGNSYKLNDDDAESVKQNPYCAVYCKEDYLLTVPYTRQTEPGRYFRIGVKVKGQEDCYTSKINYSKYKEDIMNAQLEIVKAYNSWRMYYEITEKMNWTFYTTVSKSWITSCSSRTNKDGECTGCSRDTDSDSYDKYSIDLDASGAYWNLSFNEQFDLISSSQGNYAPADNPIFGKTIEYDRGSCGGCDSCSCDSGTFVYDTADVDYNNRLSDYQRNLGEAAELLTKKIAYLKNLVDTYNSCVADPNYSPYGDKENVVWKLIYDYNPIITYNYDEPEPGFEIAKWMDQVKSTSCGDNNCDVMIGYDEKINAEHCSSDIANCSTSNEEGSTEQCCTTIAPGNTVNNIFYDNDNSENEEEKIQVVSYCDVGNGVIGPDYSCNDSSSTAKYNIENYFNCSGENIFTCSNTDYNVTNIDYVHKVATAEGTYDTARVFYTYSPYGNVIIQKPGAIDDGESLESQNYSVVDGLPVGINTLQGRYFYKISIDNIGKYYSDSSGKLGRIFGDDSTSLTGMLDERKEITTINDDEIAPNEYACSYTVGEKTGCYDDNNYWHDFESECGDQDWDSCEKDLCPQGNGYCVKQSESYYVCETRQYDEESCTPYSSREAALSVVGCQPGEKCKNNFNCCPDCEVICIGKCVYIKEKENYPGTPLIQFRSISPSKIHPNERLVGYNWQTNPSLSNVLVAQKALNTISTIEERVNSINVENPENVEALEDYTLKVTLTPEMATYIREYNANQVQDGNYNDNSLTCYDYTIDKDEDACKKAGYYWNDKGNTCALSNIFCYSNFLDELEDDFAGSIETNGKRPLKVNRAHYSNMGQASGINGSDYLVGGEGGSVVTNDYWTIYIYNNLDINGDKIPDIGPSWR